MNAPFSHKQRHMETYNKVLTFLSLDLIIVGQFIVRVNIEKMK